MENKSNSFRDLIVWQKAHSTVLKIYNLTKSLPKEELFCITSQIRRSSISIAANIAEGYKKKTASEKLRYFNISEGSIEETKYFLILINDLNYADTSDIYNDLEEISKILYSYKKSISKNNN